MSNHLGKTGKGDTKLIPNPPIVNALHASHGNAFEILNPIVIDTIRSTLHNLANTRHDDTFRSKGSFELSISVLDYPIITNKSYRKE